MTQGDIIGLVLSYVYAFGLLFGVEAIGKGLQWRQEVTRKIVHIGAGMWIWGILYFFDQKIYGVIPFATFIVLNYVFYRMQSFKAMDTTESTLGTVYFAFSITVLFVWLWRTDGSLDQVPLAAAGVMAMTWGDALASLIGLRWGNHTHTSFGHHRSWEGTAAMAVVSLVAIGLTLALLPNSALSPNSVPPSPFWAVTLAGALVATVAEAVSPAGTDNLSVPLLSTLAMWLVDSVL